MWAYVDDTGGGDDASGWGSNPVRRLFGPGTVRFPCAACKLSPPPRADPLPAGALSLQEWWVEECACCLCGCLSTGPVFIIIGLLFLVRPHAPPCCSRSTRARNLCGSLGAAGSSGSSAPQWRRTPRLSAAPRGAHT